MATITALNIYPVKSCRGIALERARIAATGFDHDREWLIVDGNGRFVTHFTHEAKAEQIAAAVGKLL